MDREIKNTITNIYKINLNVKKYEQVIVFTDNKNKEIENIAKLIEKEGRRFSKKIVYMEFPSTGNHGVEPPEILWIKAFGQKAVDILKAKDLFKPGSTEKNLLPPCGGGFTLLDRRFHPEIVQIISFI